MKQSKFLMIRLAARIMLYFAMFSYRGNNEVAGHAVGSAAREPIEQGVGRYLQAQEVPVMRYSIGNIKPPSISTKDKRLLFYCTSTKKCFFSSSFHKACCQNQNLLNPNASCDLKKKGQVQIYLFSTFLASAQLDCEDPLR